MRAKSVLKEDSIKFKAKYSPDCCRIPNASGLSCVSVPPKVFVPPETPYSGAGPVTTLFYLQCMNYTDSKQIIFIFPTKCQHFGEISRKAVYAICKVIAIYRNYRIFVKEILLEIDFTEIAFIGSNWPATKPHYSLNFSLEKIGPRTGAIKLADTFTSNDKTSQLVCFTELR